MSETSHMLSDLIEASQEGADFYTEAAASVSDKELSKLFKQMASVKSRFVHDLSAEVPAPAKPTKSVKATGKSAKAAKPANVEAWVGQMHSTYRGLVGLGKLGVDQVNQLDVAEAQLMERIQQVRHDKSNSYVIRVHAMHDEGKAKPVHDLLRARKRRLMSA